MNNNVREELRNVVTSRNLDIDVESLMVSKKIGDDIKNASKTPSPNAEPKPLNNETSSNKNQESNRKLVQRTNSYHLNPEVLKGKNFFNLTKIILLTT